MKMHSEAFAPDLSALLEPTAAEPPCGPALRYDPAYVLLRRSREEDDPSLPMREWERPLKKADWRAVARDCETLIKRSKDLQLVSWLTDAWLRQHQVQGFSAGIDLMAGLVERYWDGLHPLVEDGDNEARIAVFVWMNENLPVTLRLQVPLVAIPDGRPPFLNLAQWERVVMPPPGRDDPGEEGFTREQLLGLVDSNGVRWLTRLEADLAAAREKWDALVRAVDERLAGDSPSLGKVGETLARMQRACVGLLDGRGAAAPVPDVPAAAPAPVPHEEFAAPPHTEEEPTMSAETESNTPAMALPAGPITSRQEAYRMLEAAATFLQRTEPHSPTPYLVKRAIAWGQLSLPDLMQEVMREEGDLGRFFSMLGINMPRE